MLVPCKMRIADRAESSPNLVSELSASSNGVAFVSSALCTDFSPDASEGGSSPSFGSSEQIGDLTLTDPQYPIVARYMFSPPVKELLSVGYPAPSLDATSLIP